jgi:hypothetical protein
MFKLILTLVLVIQSFAAFSQDLTPEEQRKLQENKAPTGLKKVNYENETSDKQEGATGKDKETAADMPSLSSEQSEKLKTDVETLKLKQNEANKLLEELDKEEE